MPPFFLLPAAGVGTTGSSSFLAAFFFFFFLSVFAAAASSPSFSTSSVAATGGAAGVGSETVGCDGDGTMISSPAAFLAAACAFFFAYEIDVGLACLRAGSLVK